MPKKNLGDLFSFCDRIWTDVDTFCGDIAINERAVIFGAVRQRLTIYRRPEVAPVVEKVPENTAPKKKKEVCRDEFDVGKDSKCLTECKENSPEKFEKCLEKFQDKVAKKANVKKKKKPVEEAPTKKGRTFDKDFWGFDKKAITGKINDMCSKKFCTRKEIAEALGIDGKRVAVHFSNLKTSGHILKKKKKGDDIYYKLTREVSE